MHEGISGGSSLKMADESEVTLCTPTREKQEIDKENILTCENMKTVNKLNSLSPFIKNGNKGFKILSDEEIAKKTPIHSQSSQLSKVKFTQKRRSLATLQPSSDGKGKLAGNGRESLSIKEAFKRKKDTKHTSNSSSIDVKTTNERVSENILNEIEIGEKSKSDESLVNEALELMKKTEKIDDSYWKNIAEERRTALEETLSENEKLYDEIDKLSEENEKLKTLLSEAECYKLLYNNLIASDKQENEEPTV